MQHSRRNRYEDYRNTATVAGDAEASAPFADSNVTLMGDHLHHHGEGARPGTAQRERRTRVVAIAHDRRATPSPKLNQVLAALSASDYSRLLPYLEPVSLPSGWVICEANSTADYVYFPTTGIVSLLYELENGTSLEVAATGNDGVVGVAVFMGGGTSTSRAVVRNAGYAYRLRASILKSEFENNSLLRQTLLRCAQALISQTAQTAVCHGHHQLEQQFCRLLLVSVDRLPSDEVVLTHDTISNLLGVRRESITAAAGSLQAAGLIQYHRGRITVLDRAGLESRVCECYGVVKSELARLMPRAVPVLHAPKVMSHCRPASNVLPVVRPPVGRFRSGSDRARVTPRTA